MTKVSVIGSGAWGTALAAAAARAGNDVVCWDHNQEAVDAINVDHINHPFLPEVVLPENVSANGELSQVLDADLILLVVPVAFLRSTCEQMKSLDLSGSVPVVVACKGIENDSFKMVSEIVGEYLQNPIAVLSGPNFADEVAKGVDPAATTIACADIAKAEWIAGVLGTPTFRTYFTDDIIGAQVGGAVKNVLAIACGIADGKGFGANTKAALITRGVSEIMQLCQAKGGKVETLLGLSGIGDIMLTCGSTKSRNNSLGYQLGQGKPLEEVLGQGKTVEGYFTTKSVYRLCQELGVSMPIVDAVYQILYENVSIDDAIRFLLQEPFAHE